MGLVACLIRNRLSNDVGCLDENRERTGKKGHNLVQRPICADSL
jgi:hypothetical protein